MVKKKKKKDYGTIALEKLLEDIEKMTPEEYEELYQSAMKKEKVNTIDIDKTELLNG